MMLRTMIGRSMRWMALIGTSLLLASCGGGGGGCTDVFGGGCGGGGGGGGATSPTPTSIDIVLSASSISNSGTETVVATVIALNANNNAMPGVTVTVAADTGVITAPSSATDETGTIEATVGIGSNATPRTITITASAGGLTRSASLQVTAGGGSVSPSDLILTLNAGSIINTGAETVTATVTALDAKRNVLPGATVDLSVDAGATVAPSGTVTNAVGVVTGAIGIGGNPTNRTITVTAVSGGLTRTASLVVSDAPVATGPVASDLTLALSANQLQNGGTETITATATAVDANRNALAGIPVTFRVDASAVALVSGPVTDASGQLKAQIGLGSDRSKRTVTVTATSGTLTRTASFAVEGAELTAFLVESVKPGSIGNEVVYTLVDTNGNAMAGEGITVTRTGAPSVSGLTNASGTFVYTYDATGYVDGQLIALVAVAAGDDLVSTIEVKGDPVPPAVPDATVIASASITPSPSVVAVNPPDKTDNQVELRALFVDANNQPIPNVRVRFDLADTPSGNTDGEVSWVGLIDGLPAYSNTAGVARGTFVPKQRSSPTNGVTVRACYAKTEFAAGQCPNSVVNTLTVTDEALAVNIRTNEFVKDGAQNLTYIKEFVVMVVDAAGQAKADVLITPSVDLLGFYKGYWAVSQQTGIWVQVLTLAQDEFWSWKAGNSAWEKVVNTNPVLLPSCPNEDVNRNGVRDAAPFVVTPPSADASARAEDLNWNNELDPRKSDVAIKMVDSARTDANGLAVLQIEYGRNLASWVDFAITVTATGVAGTEARARYVAILPVQGNLPYPPEAVTDPAKPPAFQYSPYGRASTCIAAD